MSILRFKSESDIPAHNAIDMAGLRFGRLEVIRFSGNDKRGERLWVCVCDCGNSKTTTGNRLRRGLTKSCGCLSREATRIRKKTHGKCGSRVYGIWNSMIQRCTNEKSRSFDNYGGRGIVVCERWMKFENFYEDMGDPPDGMSIERTNNRLGYNKENCVWATDAEQSLNKRTNRLFVVEGVEKPMIAHVRERGLCLETVKFRLKSGFSVDEAFQKTDFRICKRNSL